MSHLLQLLYCGFKTCWFLMRSLPSKTRTATSAQMDSFVAIGVRSVNTAVPNTPNPKTHFPPILVARKPPGILKLWWMYFQWIGCTWVKIYPAKNEERTIPSSVEVHLNSSFMGCTATLKHTRNAFVFQHEIIVWWNYHIRWRIQRIQSTLSCCIYGFSKPR